MQLMMDKLERKTVATKPVSEPYCCKYKKTGHYASQYMERKQMTGFSAIIAASMGTFSTAVVLSKLSKLLKNEIKVPDQVRSKF